MYSSITFLFMIPHKIRPGAIKRFPWSTQMAMKFVLAQISKCKQLLASESF